MIAQYCSRQRQRGTIAALTAIGMLAILAMAGLALDMSHAFLNKTRLQNAADAAALAAAKELDDTGSTALADQTANTVFMANAAAAGNGEVNDAVANGMTITTGYSDTLYPFVAGGAAPRYVRVSTSRMELDAWFIGVLGLNNKEVDASAVAGPSPTLDQVCNVAPIMVCGEPDTDPDDNLFHGYEFGEVEVLKTSSGTGNSWEVGPGNFQLIRLEDSQGGADIRENLAGTYDACLATSEDIPTEPGNTIGPVYQGLNTRLGIYSGPLSNAQDVYPPDLVTTENTVAVTAGMDPESLSYNYDAYQGAMAASNYNYPNIGVSGRRILRVPIGQCTGTTNGQGDVELLNFGCFFLLQAVGHQGNDAEMYGQFVEGCSAQGFPGPAPNNGPGPYIIQLYEDDSTVDS